MQRIYWIGISLLLLPGWSHGQDVKGIHLQGIARNEQGLIVANKQISLRISILSDTIASSILYQEIKSVTTNVVGLFFINIGADEIGKLKTSGDFSDINWSLPIHYVRVEIDPSNAFAFKLLGTERMEYVPKALYAVVADKLSSPVPLELGGTGVTSLREIKQLLAIDKINNTPDSLKPMGNLVISGLNEKLKKTDTIYLSNRINTLMNTATAVKFFGQQSANKISITNNSNALPTRVTITDAGVYHVNYTIQCLKQDAGNDEINIWIRRNGSAYANSNSGYMILGGGVKNNFQGNYFVELGSNDYIELFYSIRNSNSQLVGSPSTTQTPSRPAIPSAMLTIHSVQ
jgi:hypothetical protein